MANFSQLLCLVLLILAIINVQSSENEKSKDEKSKDTEAEIGYFDLKTKTMEAKLTNWGASLMSFYLPDKDGKMADVVLGYDNIDSYKNDTIYFGATVGRVANRIGGAKFTLDGVTYKLTANDGKNSLHGGNPGFSDVIWKVHNYKNDGDNPHITFIYESSDGEQGFPGKLKAKVTYKLYGKKKAMSIKMKAKAGDKPTPVNLAHHTYWNLAGHNSGDILSHNIQILGSHVTPTDSELIPSGQIQPVKGTPYDFLESRPVGSKLNEVPQGYDINFCLDVVDDKGKNKPWKKVAAVLEDPKSGRRMELLTNQPGLQFYTGGMLKQVKGKEGAIYKAHAGLCLETQGYPDAVNHNNFPSQIVKAKENYHHFMLFKFSHQGEKAQKN